MHEFINTGGKDDLSDFLLFTTGSMIPTGGLRPECIKVSVEHTQGFFASTCSFELKIPANIPNSAEFKLALKSIKGNRFTTVWDFYSWFTTVPGVTVEVCTAQITCCSVSNCYQLKLQLNVILKCLSLLKGSK